MSETDSFEGLSEDDIETHLRIRRYGDFLLTEAVSPSYDVKVRPTEGYRHDQYEDLETGVVTPVIMAAVSAENLFEVFMDLVGQFDNETVDVVLETSHGLADNGGHQDLYREAMDAAILLSHLYDFEDLLLNDGCIGIAVLNPSIPVELQFDEHKLLIMYGDHTELAKFEAVFAEHNILCDDEIEFITEAGHLHASSDAYFDRFKELCFRLGLDFNE